MCILFVKTNPNPGPDQYYLVLANIRDEYLWRPTQSAHFWEGDHQKQIIGGKDMQKDREGGTWLAMNTNGKVGALLNILVPNNELSADKKSRGLFQTQGLVLIIDLGFLVVDYLDNNCDPKTYFKKVNEDSDEYNGFRLFGLQIEKNRVDAAVYSNLDNQVIELSSGVHALGNNRIEGKLWPKVKSGKQKFEQIVNKYETIDCKQSLIEELFQLMSDQTKYEVDQQMQEQGMGKASDVLQRMNAMNVMVSEHQYGSRTRTLILIDSDLNVDYIERTMKEPIDANKEIQWITTEKKFKIQ